MATERSVQEAVWQLELGRGKSVLRWVVVVLAAVGISLLYTANQFRGLEKREAMDQAQLARHLARGDGFTTSILRPVALWHLKTYRSDHSPMFEKHPDTYNPPLYPLALSLVFRLMPESIFIGKPTEMLYPAERWAIVPFSQACLLLSLLLIYVWARQLFDQRVAVTAALLLLFSDTLWAYSVTGLHTSFLMLLFLGAMYCLFRADRRLNPPDSETPAPLDTTGMGLILASAVLMGLCFLTRYSMLFLVAPMAIYAARMLRGRRSVMWALVYVAVVLAVITPWLMRNFNVSHSLLGTAKYQFFSTELFERTYDVNLQTSWTLSAVATRFLIDLRRAWIEDFRAIGTDILVFFFVVGVMYGFRHSDTSRLRVVLIGCLLAAMAGMGIVGLPYELVGPEINGGKLLVLFLPIVAVFGCAFFYILLDRVPFKMQLTRGAAIGAFVLLNVAPMIFTILPPRRALLPYPPYCQPYMHLIARWYTPEDTGMSDMPWAVAWYMDRRALWLPATPEEYYEIHDFVAPHNTQFAFFTPYMLNRKLQTELLHGEFQPWASVVRGQLPDKFPLRVATAIPPGADQVLITDRARWRDNIDTNSVEQAIKKASD